MHGAFRTSLNMGHQSSQHNCRPMAHACLLPGNTAPRALRQGWAIACGSGCFTAGGSIPIQVTAILPEKINQVQ